MNAALVLAALGLPLAIALAAGLPPVRRHALRLLPAAPLPALLLAVLHPPGLTVAPDLLLGATFGLDARAALFLGGAAFLWTMAGVFAAATMRDTRKPAVFAAFWCVTLAGNLGVFLARDAASFYVAFAAVSLAATVLVLHDATPKALRAGRVYLVLAIVGETALLAGLLIALEAAPSPLIADLRVALATAPLGDAAVALLVIGFGIKAGLVPLHVWLPLAHPAAPTAASAALSGAIVKAGIFGMIAFLPPGAPGWGALLMGLGLFGAFAAALVGLAQRDAKALLAYSTVSQMGLVIAGIGAALGAMLPEPALSAATLYSLHHGLAKAALFLAVGLAAMLAGGARAWLLAGCGLVALSVAGLPLTGGAAAKAALKDAMPGGWTTGLVALSGATTALLLLRLGMLLAAKPAEPASARVAVPAAAAAAFLGLGALVLPVALLPQATALPRGYLVGQGAVLDGLWPLALAGALALAAWRWRPVLPAIPEGDVVVPLEAAAHRAAAAGRALAPPDLRVPDRLRDRLAAAGAGSEAALRRWAVAGGILLALAVALAAAGAAR